MHDFCHSLTLWIILFLTILLSKKNLMNIIKDPLPFFYCADLLHGPVLSIEMLTDTVQTSTLGTSVM